MNESRYAYVEPVSGSPNRRIYHSRLRLLEEGFQVQSGLAGASHINDTTECCSILAFLLAIPGVAHAQVTAWSAVITKSPIFSWEEIESQMAPLWIGIPMAVSLGENQDGNNGQGNHDSGRGDQPPTGHVPSAV